MLPSLEKRLETVNAPVKREILALIARRRGPSEVYGLLKDFFSRKGKSLRPALCLESCQAVGGRKNDALQAAAAIEMFHNFTLIHDDIEDNSLMRRGAPCLHIRYGLPLALNAGDGLFMMVLQEAMRIGGPRREKAVGSLLAAFTKVLEGQAIELGWYRSNKWNVAEKEYYTVVKGKTGALIAASCEVGGILGGASPKACRALSEFGMGLGVGFQIIDDVLNIVGDEKKYGKEIGGDIQEGKRTLITIWALEMLPGKKRARLAAILRKKRKSDAELREAISLLRESGAPEKARRTAETLVARAVAGLSALPGSSHKKTLLSLAGYVTERQR